MRDINTQSYLSDCTLCPRACHVDRNRGMHGYCGMDSTIWAARAALHMWEEPCISGEKGSGAVFFTGCNLRCCFCQNREIAIGKHGKQITTERLADIFLELEQQGAANINLVTGTHYVPQIIEALELARCKHLQLPIIYNCGGYESKATIEMLKGYVDVYLPDFKYMDPELAKRYSNAEDYPEIAKIAIAEMVSQTGECVFDENGYIKKGTIVRHLILPGHKRNSVDVLKYLFQTYKNQIYISIMNQFTPVFEQKKHVNLNRKVTKREYEFVINKAIELGIENGFFQEGDTAKESFIPDFYGEGL